MHVLNKRHLTFFTFFLTAGILLAFYLKMGWGEAVVLAVLLGTGTVLYVVITKKNIYSSAVNCPLLGQYSFYKPDVHPILQRLSHIPNIPLRDEFAIIRIRVIKVRGMFSQM